MIRSLLLFIPFCLIALVIPACQVLPEQQPPAVQNAVTPTAVTHDAAEPPPTATGTITPSPTATPSPVPPSPTNTPDTPTPVPRIDFPDPTSFEWRLVVSGLTRPVGLVHAGDGSGRIFVLEQPGLIRIIQDDQLLPLPFLDISHQVTCCGERGLLGVAFHPEYEQNGFFFLNYIDLDGNTVIARFMVSGDKNTADPDGEVILLNIEQPYGNHNGGGMAFGPDGYLYLGLGDGGSGGDPQGNAQNPNTVLGKLLRIDVDRGEFYTIPEDNPYAQGGGEPEVWATGLRNPWRFSFDQETGDLYLGDVGQNSWEEINYLPAGSSGGINFGWNYREGSHPYSSSAQPEGVQLIDPVAEYGRDQGYSVTGGVVYRGEQLPAWWGIFLYGDYGSGHVWGLYQDQDGSWENALMFQSGTSISSFGEDESGEVYLVDLGGSIYRLESR